VLFGDEWPQIKVKNMASGQQELVPGEDLIGRLTELL
jgi:hypothetical protein